MWRRLSGHLQRNPNIIMEIPSSQIPLQTIPDSSPLSPLRKPRLCSPPPLQEMKKTVADVMQIATGHEREEIEADFQGINFMEMDYPSGPFGTKEAPAIVKSIYNKRIVGCPGGGGEDEHDIVWFWLEKDKPHECPVCSQYFKLEVVGPGGLPDSHIDDNHPH